MSYVYIEIFVMYLDVSSANFSLDAVFALFCDKLERLSVSLSSSGDIFKANAVIMVFNRRNTC